MNADLNLILSPLDANQPQNSKQARCSCPTCRCTDPFMDLAHNALLKIQQAILVKLDAMIQQRKETIPDDTPV